MKIGPKTTLTILVGVLLTVLLAAAGPANAALKLVPGTFESYASNSLDPSDEWVGNPEDLDTRAGSHPFVATVAFAFESVEVPPLFPGEPSGRAPGGNLRNLTVDLPPGFIGNPTAVPFCPQATFENGNAGEIGGALENACPVDSQVGTAVVDLGSEPQIVPVFDIEPPLSQPALLGFKISGVGVYMEPNVRSDGDYGLRVRVTEVTQSLPVISSKVTIWGVPADPAHNAQRFRAGEFGAVSGAAKKPFLTNPSNCQALNPTSTISFESWQEPGFSYPVPAVSPPVIGCNELSFSPSLSILPSNSLLDSPSGATTSLDVPQNEAPFANATPPVEDVTVTLPKGLTISPSAANGLGACTDQQLGFGTLTPAACPDSAKIGSGTIRTPLLKHPLTGAAYIGAPLSSDPASGQLYRLFLSFEGSGVVVKLRGEVRPDPATGQLQVAFPENPQVPFEELTLNFFGGPNGALATPPFCGRYGSNATISSWSGQSVANSSTFNIDGGCSEQGSFAPSVQAGVANAAAGETSPFTFEFSRADGQLDADGVAVTLPPGLAGVLAGVPYCSEQALAAATSRSAAAELGTPSCPSASRIGSVTSGVGPGSNPFYVTGSVYLAGPYKGAPLSIAVILPAKAGPYDLGTVVVRAAIHVDPTDAQIRVVSDPLPRILAGVPLRLRSVRVTIDRPGFMRSPTSCRSMAVGSVLYGVPSVTGAGAGSDSSATVSSPFQLGSCASLNFAPSLKLSLSGQTRRTGNPAIKAVLTQPKGNNANIAQTAVILPKGMLIDNAHINNPCTRVQFNAGKLPGEGCPAASILGSVRAWTPLLANPLEGKVYFRSNGGERQLPDLVAVLRGQIEIQLVGFIDSVGKKGAEVRRVRTRFQSVPDAPVSRFELKLAGGKRGLLENSKDLCKASDEASYFMTGQNGKLHDFAAPVQVSSCGKHKGKKRK